MSGNVWVLKLVTGDEVIANGKFDDATKEWIVERPYVLQVMQDPRSGQYQAGLAPYFMADKDADCNFKDSHVVSFIEAPLDVRTGYLKQTTGIQIASAGSIIQ